MNIIKEDMRTKEIQAITMSVSKNGSLGLFCGAYNILLLTLDDTKIKRKTPINKSLDPMICQFNKTSNENFAITSNNACKIYDTDLNKIQSLKAHTKSICSIDWHPKSLHHIATSSMDHLKPLCIWDLRNSKNPCQRIDTLGIHQVKWNKINLHLFATACNSEIRIWDDRKLSFPTNVLAAHSGVVNDFDWHCDDENVLVSCGQETKIKIWNFLDGISRPTIEFDGDAIFSHVRFDSLGNIVTLASSDVPRDNQIAYWDAADFHKICATTPSANTITGFDWKRETNDSYEFVTLHRNSDFKLWQLDRTVGGSKRRRIVSYMTTLDNSISNDRFFLSPSPDYSFIHSTNVIPELSTPKVAIAYQKDLASTIMSHHSDPNLIMWERQNKLIFDDQEVRYRELDRLTSTNQVTFDKNFDTRSVIAHFTLLNIKCSIQFMYRSPPGESVPLDVIILRNRSEKIRPQNLEELEKILKATVDDCRGNTVPPIEKCIDVAMDYLNKLSSRFSLRGIRSLKEQVNPSNSYCNLPDVKVPFPRICGGTFNPSGFLICFVAPAGYISRFHDIPRSLAEIAKQPNYTSAGKSFFYDFNTLTIGKGASPKQYTKTTSVRKLKSCDFNLDTATRKLSWHTLSQKLTHLVVIYNASPLSLFSPHLASEYSVNIGNIENMCQRNSSLVTDLNRKDLVELWKYCTMLANGCKSSYSLFGSGIKPWAAQSMGRSMCEKWLDHFIRFCDIQSAAMLVLVMQAIDMELDFFIESKYNLSSIPVVHPTHRNVSQESLMDNMHPDNTMIHFPGQNYYAYYSTAISDVGSRNTVPGPGRFRTSSFGDYDHTVNTKKNDSFSDMILLHKEHSKLIDPTRFAQYSDILLHYVHMLTAQNLLTIGAKIVQKIMPAAFTNNYFAGQYNFSVLLLRNCVLDHRCRSVYIDEARSTVICSDCTTRNLSIHSQDLNIKSSIVCSVCRLHVRGMFSVCVLCNHGGHVAHIISWFSRPGSVAVCPTGCGCACLSARDMLPDSSLLVGTA